uniref:E3 ubiquitin-protein ligase listerin n=1 Tax=Rhizophora mucronata TaxID=61149 RepID=A0A2P2LM14_RHIMU
MVDNVFSCQQLAYGNYFFRRDLAPHLKSLMGPWWFSQFDPVSEVSVAAKRSLQAAFPLQEKRLDAVILCTSEIFVYIEENLKLTPQAMLDKSAASDELEEMHRQVISSTLLALATLLDVLFAMQSESTGFEKTAAEPKHASKARMTAISFGEKLFSAHRCFLDFVKSESPAIRSATYSVLKSFIKSIPQVFYEGNMKTLAAAILGAFQEKDPMCHSSMWEALLLFSKKFPDSWTLVNVQKVVLNRLWHFLGNGCFGSQQVSYPALILYLDTLPPKTVAGEKFFHDFFHNLWDGRNHSHSTIADQLAFFCAFKECFLWVLCNASRYFDSLDSLHHFRVNIVKSFIVKLLWEEYFSFTGCTNQDGESYGMPGDSSDNELRQKTVASLNAKHYMRFSQELGKCIIGLLSGVYLMDINLLSDFCLSFEDTCLGMFQQLYNPGTPDKVEKVINFFTLLEQHSLETGEMWPVKVLVGPVLAKSFPLIRSLDSPDGVRLLSVAVSLFGPRKIVEELFIHNNGYSCSLPDEREKLWETVHFMQVFKETFLPWCLLGCSPSTSSRLDLLLALLNDECFSEQWHAIISYATNEEHSGAPTESTESDYLILLAMLLEKARVEMTRRKAKDLNHPWWSNPEHWHCQLLESAALAAVCSPFPFRTSVVHFLCAVIGGSSEVDHVSFVERKALILILKELNKKLLAFVCQSSFISIRGLGALLIDGTHNIGVENNSSTSTIKMAQFAWEVLSGCFFFLRAVSEEIDPVASILASLFIIGWEHSMATTIDNAFDKEAQEKIRDRLEFGKSLTGLCSTVNDKFWKDLSINNRKRLGNILVKFIRSAIFKEVKLNASEVTVLCCSWMLEVLECLCHDQNEEQYLLDQLLSKDDIWPVWMVTDFSLSRGSAALKSINVSSEESGNHKFVSFIDKLISKIGIMKVIACYAEQSLSYAPKELTNEETTSRAWIAAEILCTWKWSGGSAVASFLPLLSVSIKNEKYPFRDSLLDSIFDILLDGALVHGDSGLKSSFILWLARGNELDKIEETFLRALLSLLVTLFKNSIWQGEKATMIFRMLINKLYMGEAINQNCLKILPLIVNVLVQTLCQRSFTSGDSGTDAQLDCSDDNLIQVTVKDWLERVLSLPPLIAWQAEQDMEEWFQLVIACYPFGASSGTRSLRPERDISLEERMLILEVFRKQQHSANASAAISKLPVVHMYLSKLMVISVGYCWKEFTEEDWELFFSQVRSWIQSAVVMMEEITENVNDTITNCSASKNFGVLKDLEQIVFVSDPCINVAINALESFSLFSRVLGFQQLNADNPNPLASGRWDPVRDRILEGILRLFFCTGIAEAIASSYDHEAASIVAASRLDNSYFWELVASNVIASPQYARERAVKSVEFWGLSKGPISSLYAVLFSTISIPSLQFAAYVILSSEPVSLYGIIEEECSNDDAGGDQDSYSLDLPSGKVHLRQELLGMIEKLPYGLLEMDLVAQEWVNFFLSWSLLLTHIQFLPSLSSSRERLVQYVQDSASSMILDCIFQHIPLELCAAHRLRKKDLENSSGLLEPASSATCAIKTGSLLFSVESLWPIEPQKMASFAGALYGLMLQVLPAYVRGWFTNIRDRSASSLIESFTRTWCSPPLIVNELSQIKKANFADENFEVSVSKSANEVVATYTKDETGMDLVIRLPASYPLRPVDVDCMRNLGISEVKQRKWLMSMMMFVRNQNGALAEAIRIWKSNFDKEFEGIEECPICYSVIHTANHSLPRLACKTCKHKFHSACLYKWFSTSHKSSCPLCQSPF